MLPGLLSVPSDDADEDLVAREDRATGISDCIEHLERYMAYLSATRTILLGWISSLKIHCVDRQLSVYLSKQLDIYAFWSSTKELNSIMEKEISLSKTDSKVGEYEAPVESILMALLDGDQHIEFKDALIIYKSLDFENLFDATIKARAANCALVLFECHERAFAAVKDASGRNIIHLLVIMHNSIPEFVEMIFEAALLCCGDIGSVDFLGRTCMHYAGLNANPFCMLHLLSHIRQHNSMWDVDCCDKYGWSTLNCAVRGGSEISVSSLLNIEEIKWLDLYSSLNLALIAENQDIFADLLASLSSESSDRLKIVNICYRAIALNADRYLSRIRDQCGSWLPINQPIDQSGKTLIFYMTHYHDLELVQLFMHIGVDHSIRDSMDLSARDWAIFHGNYDLANLMPVNSFHRQPTNSYPSSFEFGNRISAKYSVDFYFGSPDSRVDLAPLDHQDFADRDLMIHLNVTEFVNRNTRLLFSELVRYHPSIGLSAHQRASFRCTDPRKVVFNFKLFGLDSDVQIGCGSACLSTDNCHAQVDSLIFSKLYTVAISSDEKCVCRLNFECVVSKPYAQESKPPLGIMQISRPLLIGHRGMGMNRTKPPLANVLQLGENSIESFQAALRFGAAYVEFDVQLTQDLVPVLYHDCFLNLTQLFHGSGIAA